ncbi:MAG: hypothetical protein GY950_21245, partial [bacterium]|nr:hypothetical protein [bacterium]
MLYLVFRDFRTNQERDPVPLWYTAFDGFNWRYLINLHSVNGAFTSQRVGLAYWGKKVFMVFEGDNKGNMWQCDYDPVKSGQVIAHRANVITKWASGSFPRENTIAAIENAIAAGAKGIEFDVQKVEDGLIVHHDGRASHGEPKLKNLTVEKIQQLYPYIPTLEETLKLESWRKSNAIAFIELKGVFKNPLEVADMAFRNLGDNFVMISFSKNNIMTLQENTPAKLGLVLNQKVPAVRDMRDYDPERVSVYIKYPVFIKSLDKTED